MGGIVSEGFSMCVCVIFGCTWKWSVLEYGVCSLLRSRPDTLTRVCKGSEWRWCFFLVILCCCENKLQNRPLNLLMHGDCAWLGD